MSQLQPVHLTAAQLCVATIHYIAYIGGLVESNSVQSSLRLLHPAKHAAITPRLKSSFNTFCQDVEKLTEVRLHKLVSDDYLRRIWYSG
jgi:hypothetical protein